MTNYDVNRDDKIALMKEFPVLHMYSVYMITS